MDTCFVCRKEDPDIAVIDDRDAGEMLFCSYVCITKWCIMEKGVNIVLDIK